MNRCRARDGHTLETGDLLNEAHLALREKSAGDVRELADVAQKRESRALGVPW